MGIVRALPTDLTNAEEHLALVEFRFREAHFP
jgi:hypothetical protein